MPLTNLQKTSIANVLKKLLVDNRAVTENELHAFKKDLDGANAEDWNALWHTFIVLPCHRLWQHGVTMYEYINQFSADTARRNKEMDMRLCHNEHGVQRAILMNYLAESTKERSILERWAHESQRVFQNATRYSRFTSATLIDAKNNAWSIATSPYTSTVGFVKSMWTDFQTTVINWKESPTADYQRWAVGTSLSYAATKAIEHYLPMSYKVEAATLLCGSVLINRALSQLTDAVTQSVNILSDDATQYRGPTRALNVGAIN